MNTEILYCGDNLTQLSQLPSNIVDLIYIDPPYFTGTDFLTSLIDINKLGLKSKYYKWLKIRIIELRRLLNETGSIYIHCTSSNFAYYKILLDEIFGLDNFRSHIIWKPGFPNRTTYPTYSNKHESILFYTKSNNYTFNSINDDIDSNTLKTYNYIDENGRRFRLVSLTGLNIQNPNLTYEFLGITQNWKWSKDRMEEAYKKGLIIQKDKGMMPVLKQYLDNTKITNDNLWTDLPSSWHKDKFRFATQKPIELADRIIKISSNPGDIILDAFAGSGTTLIAAQNLGRKWIGIESNLTECKNALMRLNEHQNVSYKFNFVYQDTSKTLREIKNYSAEEFESWVYLAMKILTKQKYNTLKECFGSNLKLLQSQSSIRKFNYDFIFFEEGRYIPIEVKQKKIISFSDVKQFAIKLKRHSCSRGLLVGYKFSKEVYSKIDSAEIQIKIFTVEEILQCLQKYYSL